ncbi:MAG: TlyA family RNA methyltransferase [Bacteriovoracia bacterium]
MKKERIDVLLVSKGLAESRQKAQSLILAGQICIGDQLIDKPGTKVDVDAELRIRQQRDQYVSRAAYKLLGAIEEFRINLKEKICLDVGASTGGFTQVCLNFGAKKVYAVDVGTNQLHWSLRSDPRVVSLEKTNIRSAPKDIISEKIDLCTVDTSFISLKIVLPEIIKFLGLSAEVVALIKPQHEVGKENVGKGGLVKDPNLHQQVIDEISSFAQTIGFNVKGLIRSPIEGTTGNKEFLIYLTR